MVAGHLREQNGIYQIILSYKDANGKRKTKQISTGLKIRGNARNAERMLQQARQEFTPPEMAAEQGKEVNPEELSSLDTDVAAHQSDNRNLNGFSETTMDKPDVMNLTSFKNTNKQGNKKKRVIPPVNPNLMLQPVDQILFCDYMLFWLKSMRHSVDEDTFAGYQCGIESSVYPYFLEKGFTLSDLEKNPQLIKDYYDYLMDTRKVSANTVIHRHANIRKALQELYIDGTINCNPADRVKKPIKEVFVGSIYNAEELDQMFRVFRGDPLEQIVIFASYYGMRRSEIIGLKWKNIDFVRKTISVKHVVVESCIDGKLKMIKKDKPKTKSSNRSLPLVPQLEELLVKLLRNQQYNAKLFGDSYNKEFREYINVDPMGNLIKPNFVTQHFRLICDKNELKHIRFHDLRHSCATLLYDSGIDMKAIQEWLGHSNISTTMNIYAHLNYKNKVISANAIAGIIPNYKEKEPRAAAN